MFLNEIGCILNGIRCFWPVEKKARTELNGICIFLSKFVFPHCFFKIGQNVSKCAKMPKIARGSPQGTFADPAHTLVKVAYIKNH